MSTKPYLLGIDQGTSGSRALILDHAGQVRGYGYRPLARLYPQSGWVEQDPYVVSSGIAEAITEALGQAGCRPDQIAACGLDCQRNTDFVWDARTGQPLANAITWQDLRTLPLLTELAAWPLAGERRRRLGAFPGLFSSAMHLAWRMRYDPAVIAAARAGYLRIGFSAAWLLTALGRPSGHFMDYSLVQAMGLYDFRAQQYWQEWLDVLNLPRDPLPQPVPTVHDFGALRLTAPNGATADVPVLAMIGDQQGALFGYDCRRPGEAECTHGTSSFVNVCLGHHAPEQEKINVYFAWSLPQNDRRYPLWEHRPQAADHQLSNVQPSTSNLQPSTVHIYCLEADTAATGSAIRWMQEHARLIDHYTDLGPLAASVPDSAGVVFVPAFTGLFVPYNDQAACGTIVGLTLGSTRAHIVRAFLEALGFQIRAILETISTEVGLTVEQLRVGGGVSTSDVACQIQADMLGRPVIRPTFTETTARAAALLAGLGAGVWTSLDDLPPMPGDFTTFEPRLSADQRDAAYARWQQGVERAKGWHK
jgi:glycerol kinase